MTIHRDRQRRAYLIARLRPRNGAYECIEFGVYSERDPTDVLGTIHAVVASSDADSFQEAYEELLDFARKWYPPLARQLEGERHA